MASQESPLLSLAPELRNRIYETVLIVGEGVDISSGRRPALLASCSAIRQEATKLYYARNHLTLVVKPNNMQAVASLFQLIGRENTSLIQLLILQVDGSVAANCFLTARGRAEVRFQPPEAWDEAAWYVFDGTGIDIHKVTIAPTIHDGSYDHGQAHLRRYLDLPFLLYMEVRRRLALQWEDDMRQALQRVAGRLSEKKEG
ncbi:hypothetical protein LTR85_005836 [Meristemomyces frigidus]|nr:hypothetical protein LTR85_005836 [Meristemomyces frigidus]